MAKPPYLEEDYVKHNFKPKDYANVHNKSNKSLSFFASILSLFIYISIFYVFNLSPYTLINNNIFWFFMSNTLILIIAADYGAFSSSNKKKQDLYEEYVKHSQSRNNNYVSSSSSSSSSYVITKYDDEQVDDKQCNIISPKKNWGANKMFQLQEKKEIVTCHDSEIVPERVLEIVVQKEPKKPIECYNNEKKSPLPLEVSDGYNKGFEEKAVTRRTYQRSKSERYRPKRVVIDERSNNVRSFRNKPKEKVEAKVVEEEENNEFSRMSNEDLNRRVEEFIQKFNRQIRLQAARNTVVY